jgi:aminopeptidase
MEVLQINTPAQAATWDAKVDRLAEVAVNVGLGLARGQELVITAPLEALPLVRRITEHAYRAGALLVTTLFTDDEATLSRYQFALDESFDRAAVWLQDGLAAAYGAGSARLAITGANPALLAGQNAGKVSRANVAFSKASRPALELITRHEINWTIVAAATPAWAKLVFPQLTEDEAMTQLWEAIFRTTRVDVPDPVANWHAHGAQLQSRVKLLNDQRFSALRYKGPGTDFTLGLADDHWWCGGGSTAKNGIFGFPNMPTEEVFTTPHKDRADGVVTSTKPLSYQGTLIEGICMEFKGGRITRASAKQGEAILESMLATDDGARRLGEVALVPHSSPIAQSGLLFWNTLFDENAASHIALGQSYSTCLMHGDALSKAELVAKGANESLIHVDWMIGSGELDVDGVLAGGDLVALMRQGEWV